MQHTTMYSMHCLNRLLLPQLLLLQESQLASPDPLAQLASVPPQYHPNSQPT
jgi:hypothetical protein